MKLGIVCYASVGGSGVVATELAHALAHRGHDVHLMSAEVPFRWRWATPGLSFERVETPNYPLFREPQYLLALTNTIVRAARRHRLEVIHAHYAVPHTTAAYLARQILSSESEPVPRMVTTLHGTDITLVGSDPSYADTVAFSIDASDGITAVSESLKRDTMSSLGIRREITVIPNFLDFEEYARRPDPALRARLCDSPSCHAVVMHVSNFRAVKRIDRVIDVFARIRRKMPARLIMIGDGPERFAAERQVYDLRLADDVEFIGEQYDLVPWLSAADLFLLPSEQESFGLAALEAMACGVPVVASRVGGLPEVITHEETGFVCEQDDLDAMADCGLRVLKDRALWERITSTALADVRRRFSLERIVPLYEDYYRQVPNVERAWRGLSPTVTPETT